MKKKGQEKPTAVCKTFLDEITTEEVLQLAMMADAADEEMQLVRFFDEAFLQSAACQKRVQKFITAVEFLFDRSTAPEFGFTKIETWHKFIFSVNFKVSIVSDYYLST